MSSGPHVENFSRVTRPDSDLTREEKLRRLQTRFKSGGGQQDSALQGLFEYIAEIEERLKKLECIKA